MMYSYGLTSQSAAIAHHAYTTHSFRAPLHGVILHESSSRWSIGPHDLRARRRRTPRYNVIIVSVATARRCRENARRPGRSGVLENAFSDKRLATSQRRARYPLVSVVLSRELDARAWRETDDQIYPTNLPDPIARSARRSHRTQRIDHTSYTVDYRVDYGIRTQLRDMS